MILLGGVVHSTGSSLACPDWPTCFGTFFPEMKGGVLIEHSHRVLGTLIGLTCIFQVALAFPIRKQQACLYRLICALLVVVIVQGVLGGITVIMRLPPIVSTFHLALSQIFFLGLCAQAFFARTTLSEISYKGPSLPSRRLLLITLIIIYVQIVYGAAVRHFGYSAACGLGTDYALLCSDAESGGAVLWPSILGSQFHMMHRLLGVLVAILVVASTIPWIIWAKRVSKNKCVRLLAGSSHILVIAQILFGIWTVQSYVGTIPVTHHLAGALLLLTAVFFLYLYLSALASKVKEKALNA